MNGLKLVIKIILIILAVIVAILAAGLVFLSVTEYKPEDIEELVPNEGKTSISFEGEHSMVTFNIGYAGLDYFTDFFMDGGKMSGPRSREAVEENLAGIADILTADKYEIMILQEVDVDSSRSYHINEMSELENATGYKGIYAPNYVCNFVPIPIPPIGSVDAGLCTLSEVGAVEAQRLSLPVPFSWPMRTVNLKRCLLLSRYNIEGSDKQLVIVNLHLEAYDDGAGQLKQTQMLMEILASEYEKGNYVIAGGDFNQTFNNEYDNKLNSVWIPGVIKSESLPQGFSFALDEEHDTCRSLDKPYAEGETATYLIDGFIVSDNIEVLSTSIIDENFRYSDHQPLVLKFKFK